MSDTENRESAPAPQGEAIAATPIAIDSGASAQAAPASPKTVRIAESSFEAAHADLPPLSTLGDSTPAVITESATGAASAGGPRRGRGRGAPAGGKFGAPATAKTPIGAIEDPANMTESLSGKYVTGYADAKPAPRREQPAPGEAPAAEAAVEAASAAPAETAAPVIKEFVPPVSEGTFKADLNPEAERKAREERRQQRDQRPQGERPAREPRPQGGEFRGNREQGEQRATRGERQERGERGPRGEQGNRGNGGDNRRGERPNRPGRLTIEAPQIPVQEELSFFGKIKRFLSEKIWGVPAATEVEYKSVTHKPTPHSREWQFGNGQRGGQHRGQNGRGEFRHGNHQGGDNRGNPNRDGRHRPHARGGNHRDQHGRDGNPRG